MATLGERLRILIYERELDQKKFAALLGLKISTLNSYVNNNRTPDIDMQKKIADYFGVTVDYLVGHTDNAQHSLDNIFVGSNIDMIRAAMTYQEMSEDMAYKLNFPHNYKNLFTAKYLEDIARGKVVPTPLRVKLFASYAGVEQEFFYKNNTSESLQAEREVFKASQKENFLNHLTKELFDFICQPENLKYLNSAVKLKKDGINPDNIVKITIDFKQQKN